MFFCIVILLLFSSSSFSFRILFVWSLEILVFLEAVFNIDGSQLVIVLMTGESPCRGILI